MNFNKGVLLHFVDSLTRTIITEKLRVAAIKNGPKRIDHTHLHKGYFCSLLKVSYHLLSFCEKLWQYSYNCFNRFLLLFFLKPEDPITCENLWFTKVSVRWGLLADNLALFFIANKSIFNKYVTVRFISWLRSVNIYLIYVNIWGLSPNILSKEICFSMTTKKPL